ncbi:hypothetical protein GOL85_13350 [Sinorhizobium medicae]|nr:hypothetical protein [Sinorhizobium medicae]
MAAHVAFWGVILLCGVIGVWGVVAEHGKRRNSGWVRLTDYPHWVEPQKDEE